MTRGISSLVTTALIATTFLVNEMAGEISLYLHFWLERFLIIPKACETDQYAQN